MSVQNIAPFPVGPLTLPSTLEVVGALTADSTLEVKGATTLDTTLLVKGASSLDNGSIATNGSGTVTSSLTFSGAPKFTGVPDLRASAIQMTVHPAGGTNFYNLTWIAPSIPGVQIIFPDPSFSPVNVIYSNSGAGQSISNGLTIDQLITSTSLELKGSSPQLQCLPTGSTGTWSFNFPVLTANRTIALTDPGTSPVGLIYSGSNAGQSITGGLTLDSLTLTSALQFSIGAGNLESTAGTLTNVNIGNLTSGITLLSAPGAGMLYVPISFTMEYIYDGANTITNTGTIGFLALCYNGNTTNLASSQVTETSFITGKSANITATPLTSFNTTDSCIASASCLNQSIQLKKTGSALTMGASTGSIRWRMWYITHSVL